MFEFEKEEQIDRAHIRNSMSSISHSTHVYAGRHCFRGIKCLILNTGQRHRVPYSSLFGRISIYINHSTHFTLALTISEILRCEIFDLENVGQGHRGHNG